MNQKQIKIIIIEIVLILLGIIFYFMGDQFFNKKTDMQKELLKNKINLLTQKIDSYEKLDKDGKFTENFLKLQKRLNELTAAFADNEYNEALEIYTKLLEDTENLKSKVETYYKEKELKAALAKKEKELAKKEKSLKKRTYTKKTTKPENTTTRPTTSTPKTSTTTTQPKYTYTPLKKKTITTTSEPKTTTTTKTEQPATTQTADTKGKIDINNATSEELQKLPRIGPAYAQRIIDYRKAHNGFKNVDDLINVSGVGPKTMKLLKPLIYCGPYNGSNSGQSPTQTTTTSSSSNVKKININTATYEELQTLPKIGPKLAQNIIDYREENGPFKSYDDLLNVPRIGPKTLEQLKPYITLGEDK